MSELAAASGTYFPGRLGFATTADIEEFVATLERYEKGELTAEEWRAFRLLRGVYHQRQTDVQKLRRRQDALRNLDPKHLHVGLPLVIDAA